MTANKRSILITGCSSGIGLFCAQALAARPDWQVIAAVRRQRDLAQLRDAGMTAVIMDMEAPPEDLDQRLDEALTTTGGHLDAVFLNAGYGQFGAIEDIEQPYLLKQLHINVAGPLHIVRRLVPRMRRQGHGRIIFNSSVLGFCAMPLRGAYTASKFALEGLADTLRIELADSGIHVASIQPGPIRSRFNANALTTFRHSIGHHSGYWQSAYQRLEQRLAGGSMAQPSPWRRYTLGPEAVFHALEHALTARRPRTHYPVTLPSHALALLRRLLSQRQLHRLLVRAGRRETGHL